MKVLTVILLIVLIIGVTPAFAATSPENQQNAAFVAAKKNNTNFEDISQVIDQSDDTGVADIGNGSDVSGKDGGYIDGYDDNGDYIGNYIVVNSSVPNQSGEVAADNSNQSGDDAGDSSDIPDKNSADELSDGNLDDDGDYTVIEEVETEFEYTFELSYESDDNTDESDNDYTVIDSDQSFESETTSQIDTNAPTLVEICLQLLLMDYLE